MGALMTRTGGVTIATSSTHEELLEGAKAVAQARARLEGASTLAGGYYQSAVLSSLAGRFARLENALHQLAEAFERQSA